MAIHKNFGMLSFPKKERQHTIFYVKVRMYGNVNQKPDGEFPVTSAEKRRINVRGKHSGLSQQEHLLKSALNQSIYVVV